MATCLIGLGSNVGDRRRILEEALTRLGGQAGVRIVRRSPFVETLPAGGPAGQETYLNAAVVVETTLAPEALWDVMERIEVALGRQRKVRFGPRTLDLDMLLFDRQVLATPRLIVPHPRMAWRRFVLEPAAQVAADMVHPTIGWSVKRLHQHLDATPWYVAIAGTIGAGKTRLARAVARRSGARLLAERLDFGRLESFYKSVCGVAPKGNPFGDPASHAWRMELEFLQQRTEALAAGGPQWQDRATVSDYWFDQSLAFARLWLQPEQWEAFRTRAEQARGKVARPRLIVVLEAPTGELLRRIRARRRRGENHLTAEQLDRIGRALADQLGRPDRGPVLTLNSGDPEAAIEEGTAALQAMK
jgi:2-amino-4-hydroxy-6-hydroxymethyldihydropteridine diphosphokinase